MSTCHSSAIATCKIVVTADNPTLGLSRFIARHVIDLPDEAPDGLTEDYFEDYNESSVAATIQRYLRFDESTQELTISYESDEVNSDSEVFDFICEFCSLRQSSLFMTVIGYTFDSRTGGHAHVKYFDRKNEEINIDYVLTSFLEPS